MNGYYLGIDTSCYTTSIACVEADAEKQGIVLDERTVLSVPLGGRGLRQSDALFQHNRNLPDLLDRLFEDDALDISTDISVLQTMLAQEGLTGHRFEKPQGKGPQSPVS